MTDNDSKAFAKALFGQARTVQTPMGAKFRPGPTPEPEVPERDPNEPPRAPDQSTKTPARYVDPNASFIRGLFGRPE